MDGSRVQRARFRTTVPPVGPRVRVGGGTGRNAGFRRCHEKTPARGQRGASPGQPRGQGGALVGAGQRAPSILLGPGRRFASGPFGRRGRVALRSQREQPPVGLQEPGCGPFGLDLAQDRRVEGGVRGLPLRAGPIPSRGHRFDHLAGVERRPGFGEHLCSGSEGAHPGLALRGGGLALRGLGGALRAWGSRLLRHGSISVVWKGDASGSGPRPEQGGASRRTRLTSGAAPHPLGSGRFRIKFQRKGSHV